jgi:hypothetical protein
MNDQDSASIVITFLLLLPWLGRAAASAMAVWASTHGIPKNVTWCVSTKSHTPGEGARVRSPPGAQLQNALFDRARFKTWIASPPALISWQASQRKWRYSRASTQRRGGGNEYMPAVREPLPPPSGLMHVQTKETQTLSRDRTMLRMRKLKPTQVQ